MAVADNESALCIQQLVAYACERGLIQTGDLTWCYNALLDMLSYEGPAPVKSWEKIDLTAFNLDQTLAELARLAVSHGLVENTQSGEDSFAMRVMGLLLPKPSEVARHFNELYASEGPRAATDWFYTLCCDAGYVRRSAIARNITWTTPTTWGDLEITINLSKPEKDPREIAAAKTAQNTSGEKYPACQLCLDNEGYSGRGASSGAGAHPARQNLRIISIELNQHRWGFQYSPYAYFNEHCIAMNSDHIPMHIDHEALVNLFDFVDRFPHYFIGSNADLPIVGGSILSHDHYQGGRYEFPMMRAEVAEEFELKQFPEVAGAILKWPLSVLRLSSTSREEALKAAEFIITAWRSYTDESVSVYAQTDGESHNTVTPVVRKLEDGIYEVFLALRCNITSEKHPLGIFHPHAEYHHIKKENIGLIEVMGLAVLPPRLVPELNKVQSVMEQCLANDKKANAVYGQLTTDSTTISHADWARQIYAKLLEQGDGSSKDAASKKDISSLSSEQLKKYIYDEVGIVFSHVLEDAGVFKWDEEGRAAQHRFLESL